MNYSPQQQAVIAAKTGSLIVEAKAGAGKTTTILEAAFQANDPTVLLCAFNKRIADELTERLRQRGKLRGRMIKAQTLHSIGREIVLQNSRMAIDLDREATDHLVREARPSIAFPMHKAVVKSVRYIKETCSAYDNPKELAALISSRGFADNLPDHGSIVEVADIVRDVMERSRAERPIIDFPDMIWRPFALDLQPRGRYRCVIVDEAQDLTLGQFFLIERMLAPGGRLIVVGDLHQEIYDWRGAAGPQIWQTMRKAHNAKTLPLTWSFRCPQLVVKEARALVPDIDAAPNAPMGVVDTLAFSRAMQMITPGSFFLSRTNSGAVTAALRVYLRKTCAVQVLGGWEELGPLLDLVKSLQLSTVEAFRQSLQQWYAKESAKESLTQEQADRIEDRFKLLGEAVQLVAPSQLSRVFQDVFRADAQDAAIFSTVHKAKGLEAPHVFLLKKTFARHKRRRDGSFRPLADIPQEELNIEYVAITRAISRLTWVVDDDGLDLLQVADRSFDDDFPDRERMAEDSLHAKLAKTVRDHINAFPNKPDTTDLPDDEISRDLIDAGLEIGDEEP